MRHIFALGLLIIPLCGCAGNDPCAGKDVYIGMAAAQALPILQQCGKLQAQTAGGISGWVFRNRVITVSPAQGVASIVNLN
jgi:hypothetical protein